MSVSNEIFTSPPACTVETEMSLDLAELESNARVRHARLASGEVKTAASAVRYFLALTKPEITLMVVISAGVACLMASDSPQVVVLLHTILGTGLLAAGAATLNQYLERVRDGQMRRTSRRPLPSGHVAARAALMFGLSLSAGGSVYLFLFLNALTALLGLLILLSYLFVYTPLKRKTPLCTLVGAIPGAAPALLGWAAARNSLAPEAWALFAILFFWQFPHFYAIGWLYREDYAQAGMLMLPAIDEDDGKTAFRQILILTQLLIFASLLPTFTGMTGNLYAFTAIMLGLSFYYVAYRACLSRSKLSAKRLLHASVIYLPLLYLVMVLDHLTVMAK